MVLVASNARNQTVSFFRSVCTVSFLVKSPYVIFSILYHERERKTKENADFVHIVYLLAKLFNIFDEAFFY